jgi:hypothetical protein
LNVKEMHMPTEQHAPELERIVSQNQDIEELASGFGGDMGPAEGPVYALATARVLCQIYGACPAILTA